METMLITKLKAILAGEDCTCHTGRVHKAIHAIIDDEYYKAALLIREAFDWSKSKDGRPFWHATFLVLHEAENYVDD